MSQLKIYTNAQHEIKALYYTDNPDLTEYVIDRTKIFGAHSDPYILGYTYEEVKDSNGVVTSIISTPYMDQHYLEVVEEAVLSATGRNYIIVNHSTLEDLRAFHKKAVGNVGSALIEAGFDLNGKHYSLTVYDQTSIAALYNDVQFGAKVVAWHDDDGSCRLITGDEMLQIGSMAKAYVSYHQSRINMLGQMIKECKTKKQVLAINYKTPLDSERASLFDSIMTGLGITGEVRTYCDSSIDAAGEVQGEIYSTKGCLIEPELYDTEPFCTVEDATATTVSKTGITTFKIPVKFVDRDKFDNGVTSYSMSTIIKKLTKVDNMVNEELTNDFVVQYCYDTDTDSAYLQVIMTNNNVVSVLVPVQSAYNELTDKVNANETFYLIKTATTQMVTYDMEQVRNALGIVTE